MYDTLIYEVTDGIASITLNRPEAGNAFSLQAFRETAEALGRCDTDEQVRVVLLTGKGRHFSVGGDIGAMQHTEGYISYESARLTSKMSGAAKRCSKPVIAMVNGAAAGAGCGLALACDFRIVTEKSSFVTAFIDVGLTGDTATLYHLAHAVGLVKAQELMMLNTPIKGEEAYRLGLATMLVPEGHLQKAAQELAAKLREKSPAALALQKELIWNQFYCGYDAYCELEAKLFDRAGHTADHREAVAAFLQKRKPVFSAK